MKKLWKKIRIWCITWRFMKAKKIVARTILKTSSVLRPDYLNEALWDCDGFGDWFHPKSDPESRIYIHFLKDENDKLNGWYVVMIGEDKVKLMKHNNALWLITFLMLMYQATPPLVELAMAEKWAERMNDSIRWE